MAGGPSQKVISSLYVSHTRFQGFLRQAARMRLLGYTRVSTAAQDAQLQRDALVADGVQQRDIFEDVTSGSKTAATRPGMRRLLDYAEAGDTVVVWRIDRLGRSLIDVLNTVNGLRDSGVVVRSNLGSGDLARACVVVAGR